MRVLCTFPGRYGDLLWALPTVRALSRRVGEPVHLSIAGKYGPLAPLIEQQSYISRCTPLASWQVEETAPISPRTPEGQVEEAPGYDLRLHLGYRGWPARPLPFETLDCLNAQSEIIGSKWTRFGTISDEELHLEEPWILVREVAAAPRISVGFTDEHFELKYGLFQLLRDALSGVWICPVGRSPRWEAERYGGFHWEVTAQMITQSEVFLGDCSALHVLAVAVGTPVVLMEPAEARWNPIFYPLGMAGPAVTLVMGNDGRPTFDARHVREAIEATLSRRVGVV